MKTVNRIISLLAGIGVFLFIGSVGTVDYNVEMGLYYPISSTIRLWIIAILCCLPAIIREVK